METIKEGNKYGSALKEYTDVYCRLSDGGCGEVFWCPKDLVTHHLGQKPAQCPNCKRDITLYNQKFVKKLPGSLKSRKRPRAEDGDESCENDNDNDTEPEKGHREDVCMVCYERPPDTMVLPCEDVVVCKQCSDGLKDTPDKGTCVKCRRPIEHVLD